MDGSAEETQKEIMSHSARPNLGTWPAYASLCENTARTGHLLAIKTGKHRNSELTTPPGWSLRNKTRDSAGVAVAVLVFELGLESLTSSVICPLFSCSVQI